MPIIQGTLFFEQQGYGWTESYFKEGASTDLLTYLPDTAALAAKRAILSGNNTVLKYTRVSQVGIFRDVSGQTVNLPGKSTQESDAPATALLVFHRNALRTKSKFTFLRGIWDAVVIAGGTFSPTAAYIGYMNQFFAELLAKEWGWLGSNTSVTAAFTTVVKNLDNTYTFTCSSDLFPDPWPAQASVRITGVQGATQLNGTQIVLPTSKRIFTTKFPVAALPYTIGGTATYTTKGFIKITASFPTRITERKPGRPSYLSVGRRKARARS